MNSAPLRSLLAAGLLWLLSAPAVAGPLDGAYEHLRPEQPTQTQGKIEVVEIFWYGCPHCYDFEPYLEKWLESKPEDVEFIRIPGVLNQAWLSHARAFYAAQKLGVLDRIHRPLFDALHKEKRNLYAEDALRVFVESQGVDGEEFTSAVRSAETATRIKQALVRVRGYRVKGVPAVIVNGKYLTSASLAGSYEKLIQVIDGLVERERLTAQEYFGPPEREEVP